MPGSLGLAQGCWAVRGQWVEGQHPGVRGLLELGTPENKLANRAGHHGGGPAREAAPGTLQPRQLRRFLQPAEFRGAGRGPMKVFKVRTDCTSVR